MSLFKLDNLCRVHSFQDFSNHREDLLFLEFPSNELQTNRQTVDFVWIVFILLVAVIHFIEIVLTLLSRRFVLSVQLRKLIRFSHINISIANNARREHRG